MLLKLQIVLILIIYLSKKNMPGFLSSLLILKFDGFEDWFIDEYMSKLFKTNIDPEGVRITNIKKKKLKTKSILSIITPKENDMFLCMKFLMGLEEISFAEMYYLGSRNSRQEKFITYDKTINIGHDKHLFKTICLKSKKSVQQYKVLPNLKHLVNLMRSDYPKHLEFLVSCVKYRECINVTKLTYPLNTQLMLLMRNIKQIFNEEQTLENNKILNINYTDLTLSSMTQINIVSLLLIQKIHQMINPQRQCSKWSTYMEKFVPVMENISDIITIIMNKILTDTEQIQTLNDIENYNYQNILCIYIFFFF